LKNEEITASPQLKVGHFQRFSVRAVQVVQLAVDDLADRLPVLILAHPDNATLHVVDHCRLQSSPLGATAGTCGKFRSEKMPTPAPAQRLGRAGLAGMGQQLGGALDADQGVSAQGGVSRRRGLFLVE
jgi:hypothetical protein